MTAQSVTGWHLRGLLLVCVLSAVAMVVRGEVPERLGMVSLVGTVLLVAATVLLPGSLAPTALLVAVGLAVLGRAEPSLLGLVVVAALMHAVHLLCGICALGPPATRFELAALLPTARRWALAQAVALPVVLAVWWARSDQRGAGVSEATEVWAGVLTAVLLFGAVALARRRMR